jgi:hypothetical protein
MPSLPAYFIGGGSSPVAAADITDAGAKGIELIKTADTSAALVSLGLKYVAPLSSTAGWTLRNGSGAAAITGGKVRLTINASTPDGGWSGVPFANIAHGISGRWSKFSIDAVARLATFTGGNSADVYAGFGLRSNSIVDGIVLQARGDGGSYAVFGYAETIGPAGTVGTASPLRAVIASGQWWQRITFSDGTLRLYYGTGSAGAEPTAWTEVGASTTLTGITPTNIGYVGFTLGVGGSGSPDNVTVEWDNIKVSMVGIS